VTTNPLSKGYWNKDETLSIHNMIDLITQTLRILARKPKYDANKLEKYAYAILC